VDGSHNEACYWVGSPTLGGGAVIGRGASALASPLEERETDRNSQSRSVHLRVAIRQPDCLGFHMHCDIGKLARYRGMGSVLGSLIRTSERWPFGCRYRNLRTVKANSSPAAHDASNTQVTKAKGQQEPYARPLLNSPLANFTTLTFGPEHYFQPDVVSDSAYTICRTGVVSPVVCTSGIRLIRTAHRRRTDMMRT
jgi:hypothetical protein